MSLNWKLNLKTGFGLHTPSIRSCPASVITNAVAQMNGDSGFSVLIAKVWDFLKRGQQSVNNLFYKNLICSDVYLAF
jgi:hypothetical protein